MRQSINEILEDLMFENYLTISDLSKELSMDYKKLSNYIKGKFNPNLKSAISLANYFNCSLDYLAGLSNYRKIAKYSEPDFLFYDRYKKLLEERKVSHYKLCKDLKININNLRTWRRGLLPTFSNLIKISEYLSVSIDDLIGREVIK